nr:methyltransferase domain-containing protein [uncultured Thermanaerothrix sp.]
MSGFTHSGVYNFVSILKAPNRYASWELGRGLVVGYGEGHEASFLSQQLGVAVVGVDLRPPADAYGKHFRPILADALHIPFPSGSFDFVFSYHTLEHLSDPEAGLSEMHRVLRPGGLLYIGTPNRHRIIGYVGSYGASLQQKIAWNLKDYVDRLRGKFRNELGAHAGFSRRELQELLAAHFSDVQWLTKDYLWFKYSAKIPGFILRAFLLDPVLDFLAPALYALCRK